MEEICICGICGKSVNRTNYSRHMNLHKDVEHKCEICAKKFKAKLYLKKHLKTHETSSVFQCEKCEKVFQSKDALRLHIKTKHESIRFSCSYCSSTFTAKQKMKAHEAKCKIIIPLKCSYCEVLLNDERSLNMHLKTHNIECEVCAKTFKNKDSMKSHKRKVQFIFQTKDLQEK